MFTLFPKTWKTLGLAIFVTSCGIQSPMPKQPRSDNRQPVNRTIPSELELNEFKN